MSALYFGSSLFLLLAVKEKVRSHCLWERTSSFVFVLLLVVRVYMIMKKVLAINVLWFMSISTAVLFVQP